MLLSEGAFSLSDVLNNSEAGMIVSKEPSGASVELFDFKTSRVLGTIKYKAASNNIMQFVAVAAEKGYGPLMYELGIMTAFNKPMVPTRDADIRGGAFSVWEKFMSRSDVKKIVLQPGDEAFSEEYYEIGDKEGEIGNTALLKAPSGEYSELLKRGNELAAKYKIYPEEVKQRGDNFFSYKYADS